MSRVSGDSQVVLKDARPLTTFRLRKPASEAEQSAEVRPALRYDPSKLITSSRMERGMGSPELGA
jgi:hypothetical protein